MSDIQFPEPLSSQGAARLMALKKLLLEADGLPVVEIAKQLVSSQISSGEFPYLLETPYYVRDLVTQSLNQLSLALKELVD